MEKTQVACCDLFIRLLDQSDGFGRLLVKSQVLLQLLAVRVGLHIHVLACTFVCTYTFGISRDISCNVGQTVNGGF